MSVVADHKRKVLILGGGFGGIKVALELESQPEFEVTLISDKASFRYYPTLYKTATGGKKTASSIALSEIFKGKNVKIIHDSAMTLDRQTKVVIGSGTAQYGYDDLVVALGVVTNYFGISGLEQYAYGIKSQQEASRLRAHLHKLIADSGKPDLNYVVVGGGPTGVELAGALPGYINHVMRRHKIDKKSVNISLVEAEPRLVPRMSRRYSKVIAKRLKRLGVRLYLNQAVQAETADRLMVSGQPIKSHTVIWTAGVTDHPFLQKNKIAVNKHGKAVVDEFLQTEENIFVIGDNAATNYSGMAQTALWDAVFITDNLVRSLKGQQLKAYQPHKPIYVTPVGPGWAAVLWGKVLVWGWLGWLIRGLADFRAYQNFVPWWKASQRLLAEFESDETCKICD